MLHRRLARLACLARLALGLHPRPEVSASAAARPMALAAATGARDRRHALLAAQQQLGSTVAVLRQDFDALQQQLEGLQGALQALQTSLTALQAVQPRRQPSTATLMLTHIPKAGAAN